MKVSIITVSYNSVKTIRDAMTSVIGQSYKDIEYIIIDGSSTDGTQEIIKSFGEDVNKFISEPDKGIYDAMNKGIGLATGDIIGILNSDDMYATNDVIERVVDAFTQNDVSVVYGDLNYVNNENINVITRRWKAGSYKAKSFYYGWMPPHPTVFLRRDVYQHVGFFDISLKSASDYELLLRIFVKHKYVPYYIPYLLVKMRTGGISNASYKNRIRANKEDRIAWKMNGLKPYSFTLFLKPIRKLRQFVKKK